MPPLDSELRGLPLDLQRHVGGGAAGSAGSSGVAGPAVGRSEYFHPLCPRCKLPNTAFLPEPTPRQSSEQCRYCRLDDQAALMTPELWSRIINRRCQVEEPPEGELRSDLDLLLLEVAYHRKHRDLHQAALQLAMIISRVGCPTRWSESEMDQALLEFRQASLRVRAPTTDPAPGWSTPF